MKRKWCDNYFLNTREAAPHSTLVHTVVFGYKDTARWGGKFINISSIVSWKKRIRFAIKRKYIQTTFYACKCLVLAVLEIAVHPSARDGQLFGQFAPLDTSGQAAFKQGKQLVHLLAVLPSNFLNRVSNTDMRHCYITRDYCIYYRCSYCSLILMLIVKRPQHLMLSEPIQYYYSYSK